MKWAAKHWRRLFLALLSTLVSFSAVAWAQGLSGPAGKSPGPGLPPDRPTPVVPVRNGPPADLALRPGQMTKLPSGQLASNIALPVTAGQLRLLPTGSVPHALPIALNPQKTYPYVETWEASDIGQIPSIARNLLLVPPYITSGWQLTKAVGTIAKATDGSEQSMGLSLEYEQARYLPITVTRTSIGDGIVETVNPGKDTPFAITLSTINGVPVLIDHQAPGAAIQATLRVRFVQKGIYTIIEATGFDLDEILLIARRQIDAGK